MTIAQYARDSAVHMEAKKDGLQQRQSGDWVLRLTVQATDMPMEVMQAPMGQRYVVALVAIGDNEEPASAVVAAASAAKPDATGRPAPVEESRVFKRNWVDLPPQQQAGIVSNDPVFWEFLSTEKRARINGCHIRSADDAAIYIRNYCGVKSRTELASNDEARSEWRDLMHTYRAWQLAEKCGAA
jgi:hypothetical protein